MSGSSFTFKQFGISQERCAMKVGTDGVLIGAWASGGGRILDVGTGTGLIALMMAQRFAYATITAIDIDGDACEEARANAAASRFADRITVEQSSLQDFAPTACFDSIVSNPPFFQSSLKAPDPRRAMARHADSLPFGVLFSRIDALLTADGVFSAVVPADGAADFIAEGYLHGLRLTRRCDVRTTERKPPRRSLLTFARQAYGPAEHEEHVLQRPDGSRSEWYQKLTDDFYIR